MLLRLQSIIYRLNKRYKQCSIYAKTSKNGKFEPVNRINDMREFPRMLLYIIEYNDIKNRLNTYVIAYTQNNDHYDIIILQICQKYIKIAKSYISLTSQMFMTFCHFLDMPTLSASSAPSNLPTCVSSCVSL